MSHKRLSLELIPATTWRKNVRSIVSRETWEALRWYFRAARSKPNFMKLDLDCPNWADPLVCRICGVNAEGLELHEQWFYDDEQLVQRLTGLIPICSNCHLSIHMGRAERIGQEDKARAHIAQVNNWSQSELDDHISAAFAKWAERSQKKYTVDFKWLQDFLPPSKIHLNWLNENKRWVGDRIDAIEWAKKVLSSGAVIVDTETTGLLDYDKVEVIELAIVAMNGRVLYNSKFRPLHRIPERTVAIHGISDKMVTDSPTFRDEYSKIYKILHSKVAVAYKAEFDDGVINRTSALFELDPPECKWECAMHAYRAYSESGRWLPLSSGKHRAVDDCKAVLALLKKMAKG